MFAFLIATGQAGCGRDWAHVCMKLAMVFYYWNYGSYWDILLFCFGALYVWWHTWLQFGTWGFSLDGKREESHSHMHEKECDMGIVLD